jgi:hypothetical protein
LGCYASVVGEFDIKNDWFFETGIGYLLRRFQDNAQSDVEREGFPMNYPYYTYSTLNVANSFQCIELPLLLKCYASKKFTVEFGFVLKYLFETHYQGEETDSYSGNTGIGIQPYTNRYTIEGAVTGINKFGLDGKLSFSYLLINKISIACAEQLALTNLYSGKDYTGGYAAGYYVSGLFYVFSFGVIYQIK